jgi:alkyl hydroperoxide reductase subunit AhpC
MALYNETLPFFHKYNAEVIGIPVDGRWCHLAWRMHDIIFENQKSLSELALIEFAKMRAGY